MVMMALEGEFGFWLVLIEATCDVKYDVLCVAVADGTARHFLRKSLERAINEIVEVRQTSSVLISKDYLSVTASILIK